MATATAVCTYRITLPAEIADSYERQASAASLPIEELLARRAAESVNHASVKPLYVSDAQRQRLEAICGRNFTRPKELVEAVARLATVRVENAMVVLDPVVLERLKSRHFGDEPFHAWLAAQVREWAERAVELR